MRPAHVQAFIDRVLAEARRGARATGLPTSVVLAQWGAESLWGQNANGHANNLGSIMRHGSYCAYPTIGDFTDDWIRVLNLPLYDPVRAAVPAGAAAVAKALGESPYSGDNYRDGNHPAGWLLGQVLSDFSLTEYDGT